MDHNAAYSRCISQLLLLTSGVPQKESSPSSRITNNPFVLQSGESILEKLASSKTAEPEFYHFPLLLLEGLDKRRNVLSKKGKALIKGKQQCFEWQLESITGMGYCTA